MPFLHKLSFAVVAFSVALVTFVGAAETWKRLLSQAKQTEGTSTTEYHAAMDAAGLTGDATDDAAADSDSQPDKIPTLAER